MTYVIHGATGTQGAPVVSVLAAAGTVVTALTRNADAVVPRTQVVAVPVTRAMMIDNLHFWPDPLAGLIELRRVLRRGARVVCAFTPPSGGPPRGIKDLFGRAGYAEIAIHRGGSGSCSRPSPATRRDRLGSCR